MAVSKILSAQPGAINASLIKVEADVSTGLYGFVIVGLPSKEVDESKDRIPAAIKNSGFKSPKAQNRKVIISLSPAAIKKDGTHYDLPIALSYMQAIGDIKIPKQEISETIFLGELSLSGEILPVRGVLSVAKLCKEKKIKNIFLPKENAQEASLVTGINIFPVNSLKDLCEHFSVDVEGVKNIISPFTDTTEKKESLQKENNFAYVLGQEMAKRALLIAAAGAHNIALYGPPGTGKTMLAKAFSEILPDLNEEEMLEVTGIHSFVGVLENNIVSTPPFRSPHHSASYVSIIGGGNNVRPGEITLAHRGVLFLDEFPEFDKKVLESLRQPLEDGEVVVSRAKGTVKYPAQIILLAALNPCPCGYHGSKVKDCICKESDILRYKRKISGPIMDRIDLWVEVSHIPYENFSNKNKVIDKTVNNYKEIVAEARNLQKNKYNKPAAYLKNKDFDKIKISDQAENLWIDLSKRFALSPRAMQKVKKISRTIADLEHQDEISEKHILEAFQFRPKDN